MPDLPRFGPVWYLFRTKWVGKVAMLNESAYKRRRCFRLLLDHIFLALDRAVPACRDQRKIDACLFQTCGVRHVKHFATMSLMCNEYGCGGQRATIELHVVAKHCDFANKHRDASVGVPEKIC